MNRKVQRVFAFLVLVGLCTVLQKLGFSLVNGLVIVVSVGALLVGVKIIQNRASQKSNKIVYLKPKIESKKSKENSDGSAPLSETTEESCEI